MLFMAAMSGMKQMTANHQQGHKNEKPILRKKLHHFSNLPMQIPPLLRTSKLSVDPFYGGNKGFKRGYLR